MSEPPSESGERKRPTPVREALDKAATERPEGEQRPLPIPVRSLEPPAPPRAPAGGAAPVQTPEAPAEPAEGRPAPVRDGVKAEQETLPGEAPAQVVFSVAGEEWVARIEGRGLSGTTPDVGAPLLALSFARVGEPDRPLLEVLCLGRSLSDFTEEQLAALLAKARPFRGRGDRPEIFSETRVRKKEL